MNASDLHAAIRLRSGRSVTIHAAGLEAEAADREHSETGTALRVVSAAGGLFAGLVLLIFLWMIDVFDRPVAALAVGLVLVVITLLLASRPKSEAFLATITVCGYLVGAGTLLVGAAHHLEDGQLVLPLGLLAVITLVATKNYFLVFLATATLPFCLLWLSAETNLFWLTEIAVLLTAAAVLLLSFRENRLLRYVRYDPVRAGLALALLFALAWFRWSGWMSDDPGRFRHRWVFSVVLYALLLGAIWRILVRDLPPVPAAPWLSGAAVVLAPLISLPTVLGSLLLLLVSHRNNHFTGIGLGVFGLAYFTSQYYYDLNWSLLDKSVLLMVAGALLLLAYYFLNRKFSSGE